MQATTLKFAGSAMFGLAVGSAILSAAPAHSSRDQAAPAGSNAQRCTALAGQALGGVTIEKAEFIAKGGPTVSPAVKAANDLCRVSARATPVAGSNINIRIWLPDNWNGKMLGVGGAGFNGGFAAEWFIMVGPLSRGFAAMSTDAGHDAAEDAKWAFGQPERFIDYGYRANHVGTIAAKAIIASYYGQAARRAYFHGCSNGGRDALIEAQRYPQDYDGIVAGAPANYWTALMATFARNALLTRKYPDAASVGSKLKLVHDAALKMCDAADGIKDGLISDPTKCRFDPAVLQCKGGSGTSCLSRPEVAALRTVYQGTRTGDGKLIMPGFPVGSEFDWQWFTKPDGSVPGMARDTLRYLIRKDPNWDWAGFKLDRDYALMKSQLAPIVDASDTDLRPFARRGGKLLMYHGWEDTAIPAGSSIRYYEAVRARLGGQGDDVRLFMVPGMSHCFGGSGPSNLDAIGALDTWVEGGKAPERLVSSKYDNFALALTGQPTKLVQTRPICAWPKSPHYIGKGPVDHESSFTCR